MKGLHDNDQGTLRPKRDCTKRHATLIMSNPGLLANQSITASTTRVWRHFTARAWRHSTTRAWRKLYDQSVTDTLRPKHGATPPQTLLCLPFVRLERLNRRKRWEGEVRGRENSNSNFNTQREKKWRENERNGERNTQREKKWRENERTNERILY